MPKVRVLQPVAGVDFSWTPGEIVELPAAEAAKWADGSRCELVKGSTPAGSTTPEAAAAVETPERPRRRRAKD